MVNELPGCGSAQVFHAARLSQGLLYFVAPAKYSPAPCRITSEGGSHDHRTRYRDGFGRDFPFAAWFARCAKEYEISDYQIAKQYSTKLRHLIRPYDGRKAEGGKPDNQSQITAWRTGKNPRPDVAYRLGRSMQEEGAPVSGLDALIAGHYFIALLGTVGARISIAVARSKSVFLPFAPEIVHVSAMLDKLAPRISRELTIRKLELGISELDTEEFANLQMPLPGEELYPQEQTPLVDAGFVARAYEEKDARQKLPPTFAAAIARV